MRIHLDHHSGEPIYRQIVEAVKLEIARGKLVEGDKLSSVRGLANELGVNMRTVVKAYEELQHAGLALLQQGRGAFVTAPQGTLPAARRKSVLEDLIRRLLAEAQRLGADSNEVQSILASVAEEMEVSRDQR